MQVVMIPAASGTGFDRLLVEAHGVEGAAFDPGDFRTYQCGAVFEILLAILSDPSDPAEGVVIYIPLAYVLQKYFGFCGILAALATTNFAVGLISYLWNRGMVTCHLASVCPRVVLLEFRTFEDILVFAILSIVG
jgi:hypothetical protein